jgi:hypothetical protein
MFDPDKELNTIKFREQDPPAGLGERTLAAMGQAAGNPAGGKAAAAKPEGSGIQKGGIFTMKKRFAYGLSTAAVLAIGIFIGAGAFGGDKGPDITGYYTVDINPSVCLAVDAENNVAKATSQNDDGAALLAELDLDGLAAGEAIPDIVEAAKDMGYIQGTDQYVLVGYFSSDGSFSTSLQDQLESCLNEMVQLLLVSGTLDSKSEADTLGVSAGLLALSREVEGVTVSKEDSVADVVSKCEEIQNPDTEEPIVDEEPVDDPAEEPDTTPDPYISTKISGSISGKAVTLHWSAIDRDTLDGYKVMYSFTDSTPVYGDGHDGCKYYAWITDAGTTSITISDVTKLYGYAPGKTCYFSITALYGGHSVYKAGNAIGLKMPDLPAPTYESSTISGDFSGGMINLSWTAVDSTAFDGYKVMYSFTDSTPVYGEEGCSYYEYIPDPTDTSRSIDPTELNGYEPGTAQTCYFSITVLYGDTPIKKAGNPIAIDLI